MTNVELCGVGSQRVILTLKQSPFVYARIQSSILELTNVRVKIDGDGNYSFDNFKVWGLPSFEKTNCDSGSVRHKAGDIEATVYGSSHHYSYRTNASGSGGTNAFGGFTSNDLKYCGPKQWYEEQNNRGLFSQSSSGANVSRSSVVSVDLCSTIGLRTRYPLTLAVLHRLVGDKDASKLDLLDLFLTERDVERSGIYYSLRFLEELISSSNISLDYLKFMLQEMYPDFYHFVVDVMPYVTLEDNIENSNCAVGRGLKLIKSCSRTLNDPRNLKK